MSPVPSRILSLLLLALCGLCALQWQRESRLREAYSQRLGDIASLTKERDELLTRAKAADAEILRLNQALTELRDNSVSKQIHAEVTTANTELKTNIEKQNALLLQQNEALAKASASMQQANATITAVTAQRDELTKRLNATITEMNARQKKTEQ